MVRTSELRVREVVNVDDGRRLGGLSDLEIDLESGRVAAIVLPGPARFLGLLGRSEETVVPWARVQRIGTDVILVSIGAPEGTGR
jgi:YlmC/YmxH family sporulation protein